MNQTNPSFDPVAVYREACALHDAGRLAEAEALYQELLNRFPGNPLSLSGLGMIALQRGNIDQGGNLLEQSLQIEPNQPLMQTNLGLALWQRGRPEEALARFDQALAAEPGLADAHNYRGMVLQGLNRVEEALASYSRAIDLNPGNDVVYNNLGILLQDADRPEEALANFDRAIALKPDSAHAYCNRGNVLRVLGRLDEALASCDRAIALNPDFAEAHNNRGVALQFLQRLDEAEAALDRAIALKPDFALAYQNKAYSRLIHGDFAAGWRLNEWRWKKKSMQSFVRDFAQPLWLGDAPLSGKVLLIHAEQGFGDTIQFCRYVSMAEALGARVILEVPKALVALISTLQGGLTVVEHGKPLPHFDLHCPVMSLPLAFGTTLENIPAPVPYLFVDPAKQAEWRERLGGKTRPRVGLVWSGSSAHLNDRNRSIQLQALAPWFRLPLEFHVLQKEVRPGDEPTLAGFGQLCDHRGELGDFSDTAALVQEMDLVVSVDTSVAHLAGALGKPTWILLPSFPDFRWLLDRKDSPWYPTVTLFRSAEPGAWGAVIAEVEQELARLA